MNWRRVVVLSVLAATVSIAPAQKPGRGPRPAYVMGCREQLTRLALASCDDPRLELVAPTSDARPDHLVVETLKGMRPDSCLRAWERVAKMCPKGQP